MENFVAKSISLISAWLKICILHAPESAADILWDVVIRSTFSAEGEWKMFFAWYNSSCDNSTQFNSKCTADACVNISMSTSKYRQIINKTHISTS